MPGFIGFPELLLLGLLVLVLFGPKRLPEMGRGLGKGLREFKDSVSGDETKHLVESQDTLPFVVTEPQQVGTIADTAEKHEAA